MASVRVFGMAAAAGLLLGLVSSPNALAQAGGYVVEDLGVLPGDSSSVAWAINASGDVVGWSNGPAGTRAFLYTTYGGMVALPARPDRPRTVARDINDAGVIVGSANSGGTDLGHAVVWSGGSVQDIGTLGTGSFSEAWGVNNLGQVVGWSYTNGASGLSGVHAFLYSPAEGLVDLTPARSPGTRPPSAVITPSAGRRGRSRTWVCCPRSPTASAGRSTRPDAWPAARPRPPATPSASSVPPTPEGCRTWEAPASTT